MSEMTPRFKLPYIRAAQAQKEVTHNTALNVLEAYLQPVIEDHELVSPPGAPDEGRLWIVAGPASDAWTGKEGQIAQFIGNGWSFHAPVAGMRVWLSAIGQQAIFDGTDWVLGDPISDVTGGSVVDVEARAAINLLLAACRDQGLIG